MDAAAVVENMLLCGQPTNHSVRKAEVFDSLSVVKELSPAVRMTVRTGASRVYLSIDIKNDLAVPPAVHLRVLLEERPDVANGVHRSPVPVSQ